MWAKIKDFMLNQSKPQQIGPNEIPRIEAKESQLKQMTGNFFQVAYSTNNTRATDHFETTSVAMVQLSRWPLFYFGQQQQHNNDGLQIFSNFSREFEDKEEEREKEKDQGFLLMILNDEQEARKGKDKD